MEDLTSQQKASRKWYYKNREQAIATSKKYRNKNKESVKEYNKEYKIANRDKINEHKRRSYYRNLKTSMLSSAKRRAISRGLEFSITKEDINFPDICPILNIPFDISSLRTTYSLDRIDSSKGYTKDNIWIISQRANTMKSDASYEELLSFGNWINSLKEENENVNPSRCEIAGGSCGGFSESG